MATDRQRIRRLRRGDGNALAEIYGEHKDRLLTLAYRLLGDQAAAEDCLQDVFLKLARDAVDLRIRGNLKAYLSSCVLNRARDELRRNKRYVSVAVPDGHESHAAAGDPAPAADPDGAGRIQQALELLPPEQREAVALHVHGGLTFRRIGALQSVSINTALSRYRYGIQKLRDVLDTREEA